MRVLEFRGRTGAYLEPPADGTHFDVLKMARRGLTSPLRTLLDEAKTNGRPARMEQVPIEEPGNERSVDIEVIPQKGQPEHRYLVVFEDARPATAAPTHGKRRTASPPSTRAGPPRAGSRRRAALEAEVAAHRDAARVIEARHAAAIEQLQAYNEEVQAANEELQTLNEEMETSKEQLESVNEELRIANEEMARRNAELHRLSSDLVNIQNSTHMAVVLLGRDRTIRHFNVQAEKHFNLQASDLGRPLEHVRHNLESADLDATIREVLETTRPRERQVRDRMGRWYSLRVRPSRSPDDNVDGAVLILVDVDDLKRSELAIDSAREYAENVISTMREPLVVLDPDLRVESANLAFYQTFVAAPSATLGRLLHDLGHGQWDIPELRARLQDVLPRRRPIEDFQVEREIEPLGRRRIVINARPMHGLDGRHARIVVAFEDITERARAEDRLRESETRYRTLFDLSPVGVYTCDAQGVIQNFNRSAADLWGRTPEAGDTDERFCGSFRMFRPDGSLMPHAECPMAEVVAGTRSEVRDGEVRIERPDETWVTVIVNIRPLRNQHGEIAGAVNCFYDITGRKEAEEALRVSDRRKDEFLAMLAHELRNPLAPIRSSIEILRRIQGAEGPPSESQGHADYALTVLQRQVGQMVRLVDDLLDAGRISRGKIELRKEPVALSSVVQQVVEAARPLHEGRDQVLTVSLPDAPVSLHADPTRLAQIIGNLLNNASKFTAQGGRITLTADLDPAVTDPATADAAKRSVVIRVRDTGIGIAADRLERVFDMFAQGDMSLDRSRSGLGIGLALVRTLTELHGGSVEARSEGVGRGSEFIVRLPIAADAPADQDLPASLPAEAEAAAAPLRILIVDDNRDSAEMLAMLLKLLGHETHTAHDGASALEEAGVLDPDVILLDLGLPGLNGYEVACRIRERQGGKRPPLIVALTGWGQEEARRRSDQSGFDAHLVKPVDDVVLSRLLSQLRPQGEGESVPPPTTLLPCRNL